jgi:small subunit ribosomal protein S7
MPRRGLIARRDVQVDPLYNSGLVTKFINTMMYGGKRSTSQGIMYEALGVVQQKTQDDPLKVFKKAVDNVKPTLEVKSRRVGGSNYQVPVEVNTSRRTSLALRWLIGFARKRPERTMVQARHGDHRRREPARRRGEEEGRHPQDGRGQQGLRPL